MKYSSRFRDADSLHQACVCRDSMHLLLGSLHYCLFYSGVHRGNFSMFRMENKGETTAKRPRRAVEWKEKLLSKKEKACFLIAWMKKEKKSFYTK